MLALARLGNLASASHFVLPQLCARCLHSSSTAAALSASSTSSSSRLSKPRTTSTTQSRRSSAPIRTPGGPHSRQNGQPYDDSYLLCSQIRLLSSRKQLEQAIDLVKRTPEPTVNIVVWNVLLNEVLTHHGDITKAYELWMDMKRRGFKPSSRSFGTFFRGLATIAQRKTSTNKAITSVTTLSRVRTIYSQWLVHLERVTETGSAKRVLDLTTDEEQISILPANHYLTFLGHTNQLELMLQSFASLPTSGPLQPNSATYSLVLSFLRASSIPEHFQLSIDIFNQMVKSLTPSELDVRTISIILGTCRDRSRPDDQTLGVSIAERVLGLLPPSETHLLSSTKPILLMDSAAFSSVLTLLLKMQKYSLCVTWFDQVRDHPERFGHDLIDVDHCNLVLNAYIGKRDVRAVEDLLSWMTSQSLVPNLQSYTLSLKTAFKSVSLPHAYHFLSLLLQRPSLSTLRTSTFQPRHKPLQPSAESLSYFLSTALGTRDRSLISKSLQTFFSSDLNASTVLLPPSFPRKPTSAKERIENYWIFHLHSVVHQSLSRVLTNFDGAQEHLGIEKVEEWEILKRDVKEWLEVNRYRSDKAEEGVGEKDSMERRRRTLARSKDDGRDKNYPREERRERRGGDDVRFERWDRGDRRDEESRSKRRPSLSERRDGYDFDRRREPRNDTRGDYARR